MPQPLRVAALIDLPRSPLSGGHVKGWERLAQAAAEGDLPLDLTVYFSGPESCEDLSARAHLRQLPPVFSTAKLKFLPYVPDHTDLAPYHPQLARELSTFDVIHTTDGFFAFARTAERVSRQKGIPLVTSFHTDTPAYARVFTRNTIERILGQSWLAKLLLDRLKLPEKQEDKMKRRLRNHVSACAHALVTRQEDRALAEEILGANNVHFLRLGVDRGMFGPHRKDRAGIEADYNIPPGRIVAIFVGRLDVGKNIYTLIEAAEKLIADGMPLHIVAAGLGPAADDLRTRLAGHVSVPGFVQPDELARLYASVDVLALTSEVEIRSLAGIEAMVSGLPVLVSEKSGIAKLFDHTPAMHVVPSGADNWQRALREIAADPAKRAHMGKVALAYAKIHVASWQDVLAEDLLAVWRQSFEGASRARPLQMSLASGTNWRSCGQSGRT